MASQLSLATANFVADGHQFGPNWIFGLKKELMVCAGLVGGTTDQRYFFFLILHDSINGKKHLRNVYIAYKPCHIHFFLLIAANLALAGFFG